jgi:hypothetical protein
MTVYKSAAVSTTILKHPRKAEEAKTCDVMDVRNKFKIRNLEF